MDPNWFRIVLIPEISELRRELVLTQYFFREGPDFQKIPEVQVLQMLHLGSRRGSILAGRPEAPKCSK